MMAEKHGRAPVSGLRLRERGLWILAALVILSQACSNTPGRDPAPRRPPPWPDAPADAPLAALVDPFIGTAHDGQTFPGAAVPWGMASPGPHTTLTTQATFLGGTVANAGYLHGEPAIHGFGQTHLSGVGCPDLGAAVVVPTVGAVEPRWQDYGSAYGDERAYAGFYGVRLADPDVYVEVTATARTALYRLWFPPRSGDANVLIDVGRSVSWRQGAGTVEILSDREVRGTVEGGMFCMNGNRPTLHFVARFSSPASETGTWVDETTSGAASAEGRAGAFMRFSTRPETPLELRVGLSYVSVENAAQNLDHESADLGFDEVREAAARAWQEALGRILVEGGSESDRIRFYTALYHSLLHPNVVSDVGGQYPLGQGGVGTDTQNDRYTVFSMWDTYRTVHPLLTLVYPERQLAMLRTLSDLAAQWGAPPKWELLGEEVNMMVGDPLAVVAADSFMKGLTAFDAEGLYQSLRVASEDPEHRPGAASYLSLGYVPMDEAGEVWGPVSTTLEYELADAALARLARELGHADDAAALEARAAGYGLLFDEATGLLRPRNADGTFLDPFDPDALEGSSFQPRAGGPGYVEGTAWHYAFFVPHDTAGLAALHGPDLFAQRLQGVFDTDRFVMWNEPDMAYPYLFNYVEGEAWRTQRAVRDAMERFFTTGPSGIPGNDDAGTLSAWFVFSAVGFYPDDPAAPRYGLGSPLFDRIEITLSPGFYEGSSFVVTALDNGPDRAYVVSAELNGTALGQPFLNHGDIAAGGELVLRMSDQPQR